MLQLMTAGCDLIDLVYFQLLKLFLSLCSQWEEGAGAEETNSAPGVALVLRFASLLRACPCDVGDAEKHKLFSGRSGHWS